MSRIKDKSEQVGEAFAYQVLFEHFGAEIFIGPGIELKLQELAHVIFQDVPDKEYYGATVTYKTGQTFVSINTQQPLRIRYFTAAHELWHLLGLGEIIVEEINHERAADRFAAALMMPASLICLLWERLRKDFGIEKAVIMIADMASAPYEAVVRRIHELKLSSSSSLPKYSELEWVNQRKSLQLTESPLDKPFSFARFNKYEQDIEKAVNKRILNNLDAANKLAHLSPGIAKDYQQRAMNKLLSVQDEDKSDE